MKIWNIAGSIFQWLQRYIATTSTVIVLFIILLVIAPVTAFAATPEQTEVNNQAESELNSVKLTSPDTGNTVKQDSDAPGNYSGWTPPPPPNGVEIDPVEYLLLWDQSFTLRQAEVSLRQAGYSESEITKAAKEYQELTTAGPITTEEPSSAKATWNKNIAELSPRRMRSDSHTKWNTDGSSEIRDGRLYINDAQLDLMTIEPSTTVLYSANGDQTTHESTRMYTAGESIYVQGTFDYRIDPPRDDTTGKTRTYYTLQSVNNDFSTVLDMVNSPARYSQAGSIYSDTTGVSSVITTPGELTGSANLIGKASVTVNYRKRVETEVCYEDDDDDDDDDRGRNSRDDDNDRDDDDDDDDGDTSITGGDDESKDREASSKVGGSGEDDDDDDSGYSGGYGGGGGRSVVGQPIAETCTFETLYIESKSESVSLTASRTVYLSNRDSVDVSYWKAPGKDTAGYIHIKTPEQWASVTLGDGTKIEDPREITTQRDFSYAFERVFSDYGTQFSNPNQPPVRSYYIARATGVNIDRSQASPKARSEWRVGKRMAETQMVTQYLPTSISSPGSEKQFQHTESVTLQVNQEVDSPTTDVFSNDVSASSVVPGQELDTTVRKGGEVIEGNISAEIVTVFDDSPNYDERPAQLEVTLTNEQTGEPIATINHDNTEILVRDVVGTDRKTINTDADGKAVIPIEDPNVPGKQVIIKSTFDPSEDIYVFEDTATVGYVNSTGFIWGTFNELLRLLLFTLPIIIAISVFEYGITGNVTVLKIFR